MRTRKGPGVIQGGRQADLVQIVAGESAVAIFGREHGIDQRAPAALALIGLRT